MLIGELAQAAGTTVRALRYYEQQGLLIPRRAPNRYRDYDEQAVVRVGNIRHLLSLGFTAEDIHAFLPCLDQDFGGRECPASGAVIADKIAALDETIAALIAMRDRLNEFLEHVGGKTNGDHPGPRIGRATNQRQLSGP